MTWCLFIGNEVISSDTQLTGVPITREGTRLNHLFFADDNLFILFYIFNCVARSLKPCRMHRILEAYEKALGHKLNKDKTIIFFSNNTGLEVREQILNIYGV